MKHLISEIKNRFKAKFPLIYSLIRNLMTIVKQQLSKKQVKRLLKEKKQIFIDVGGGDKCGKRDWLSVDITKNCDIFWDLKKGIPFPNDRVTKIYSSHFLEHLSYEDGQKFLDECKRVLVPGGTFSICVPNARLYIEAYINHQSPMVPEQIIAKLINNTTRIDYVNYTAYMNGHHNYMFDEDNLLYILKLKGFRNVKLRQFDPYLDVEARNYESIYAEAIK